MMHGGLLPLLLLLPQLASAFHVSGAAAAATAARGAGARPAPHGARRSRRHLARMSGAGDEAAELQKLQATLQGLKDDGFGAEALAPLEVQIAALKRQINGLGELPPLSEAQRAIWALSDVIDAEESSDANVRVANLRRERKFLLSSLQKADGEAYAQLLSLLAKRATAIPPDDFPMARSTSPSSSSSSSTLGGEGKASSASLRASSRGNKSAAASLRAPKPVDASAEDPAAAAAALAEAEIEASLNEGIDPTFVRTFLWAEEERFGIGHLVIGERGWSRPQDKIRMKTWMAFASKVLEEGQDWPAAKACLAMADPMVDPLDREAEGKAIYADAAESAQDASRVEARLKAAYADKRYFLMQWKGRVKREGFTPDVQLGGLSRVGQMRAMGKQSDSMSQTLEGEAEFEGISKLNKWFDDLMKGDT